MHNLSLVEQIAVAFSFLGYVPLFLDATKIVKKYELKRDTLEGVTSAVLQQFIDQYNVDITKFPTAVCLKSATKLPSYDHDEMLSLLSALFKMKDLCKRKHILLRYMCRRQYNALKEHHTVIEPDWDRKYIYDYFSEQSRAQKSNNSSSSDKAEKDDSDLHSNRSKADQP